MTAADLPIGKRAGRRKQGHGKRQEQGEQDLGPPAGGLMGELARRGQSSRGWRYCQPHLQASLPATDAGLTLHPPAPRQAVWAAL